MDTLAVATNSLPEGGIGTLITERPLRLGVTTHYLIARSCVLLVIKGPEPTEAKTRRHKDRPLPPTPSTNTPR